MQQSNYARHARERGWQRAGGGGLQQAQGAAQHKVLEARVPRQRLQVAVLIRTAVCILFTTTPPLRSPYPNTW